jgi:hypothetical protein
VKRGWHGSGCLGEGGGTIMSDTRDRNRNEVPG